MSNNEEFKIDELEKKDIKPLLKEGFSLLFRSPLLSLLSGIILFSLILLSYLIKNTSLHFFPLLILIPFFSYIFCKANDHSTPFWKLDFRYFKFTPHKYIFFIIFFSVVLIIVNLIEYFSDTNAIDKEQLANNTTYLSFVLFPLILSVLSSFIFISCNFTSMLSYHCSEKWFLLDLNIKDDFEVLSSFNLIIEEGAEKSKLLLSLICGFIYFIVYLSSCFFISNVFVLLLIVVITTLFLHHFLYVVIKHICGDGGINDKVKEKVFKFSEST